MDGQRDNRSDAGTQPLRSQAATFLAWWPVIVSFIAAIAGFSVLRSDVAEHDSKQMEIERRMASEERENHIQDSMLTVINYERSRNLYPNPNKPRTASISISDTPLAMPPLGAPMPSTSAGASVPDMPAEPSRSRRMVPELFARFTRRLRQIVTDPRAMRDHAQFVGLWPEFPFPRTFRGAGWQNIESFHDLDASDSALHGAIVNGAISAPQSQNKGTQ